MTLHTVQASPLRLKPPVVVTGPTRGTTEVQAAAGDLSAVKLDFNTWDSSRRATSLQTSVDKVLSDAAGAEDLINVLDKAVSGKTLEQTYAKLPGAKPAVKKQIAEAVAKAKKLAPAVAKVELDAADGVVEAMAKKYTSSAGIAKLVKLYDKKVGSADEDTESQLLATLNTKLPQEKKYPSPLTEKTKLRSIIEIDGSYTWGEVADHVWNARKLSALGGKKLKADAEEVQARIKGLDEYAWFTFTRVKPIKVIFKAREYVISKGDVFGVRWSSNKKDKRLVLARPDAGMTRVMTITNNPELESTLEKFSVASRAEIAEEFMSLVGA